MTPGQRIKEKRKELGIRQAQLARMVDMSPSSLSGIERGGSKLPNAEHLLRIASILSVSQAWIITGKGGAIESLTPDEERLVNRMRKMTGPQKAALTALIDSMNVG